MAVADLTAYVPRLLLEWETEQPTVRYRAIEGTLVFADVSGFTRLSERLARAGGKIGAEQMTDVINALFGDLLLVAAARGGEMLKYGGDAILVFFTGPEHAPRAAAACWEMQRKLAEIGRVDTGAGIVRLRMSVGVHSGTFDFFKVGGSHEELVVAGPATTETVAMESAADATEVLLSPATSECLPPVCIGAEKAGGRLLRRLPKAPLVDFLPMDSSVDACKFLSVAIRDYLAGGLVEPDHRLATVAFLHLMDMDRQLAADGAAVVADRLDETLRTVQDSFERFGVSFLATDLAADGTKIMAATGAPGAQPDAEERMLRALVPFVSSATPLPIRAGVNRGHVFAGDVGPPFRRTFTTIGDVTNTAARVMGKAAPGQCLALSSVTEAARAVVETRPMPPFMAKGKREPLLPLEVISVRDRAATSTPLSSIIGRDAERTALLHALSEATTGGSTAIEVVGQAGSGKSTLVQALFAAVSGPRVVLATANQFGQSAAYATAAPLVRGALGLDDAASAAELLQRVERLAPELVPALPLVAAAVGVVVEATPEIAALEPAQSVARLRGAVLTLLRALGEPLVLVVEDAQWMDDASAGLLRHVAGAPGADQIALLVTTRSGRRFFDEATVLEVGALSGAAAREVARSVAPRLPPDRRNALVQRAQGNPLFLSALLAAATDRTAEDVHLPDTIEELLAARLDSLAPADRALVRTMSVLGTDFDAATAKELVGEELLPRLPRLAEFVSGEDRLRFSHALYQEAAYQSLPFRRRRELHRRVATLLEGGLAAGDAHTEQLAHHWHQAGEFERSWELCRAAAEEATSRFAYRDAVTSLRRGLEAAERAGLRNGESVAEAWRELARLLRWTGEADAARTAAKRGRRATKRAETIAALCQLEGEILQITGRHALALRWYRRGLDVLENDAGSAGDVARTRIRLLLAIGVAHRELGRPNRAIDWAQRALAAAEEIDDDVGRGHAYNGLHLARIALRSPDRARYGETALEIFRQRGLRKLEAQVLNNLGMDAYAAGAWDTAVAYYQQARAAQAAVSDATAEGILSLNITEVLLDQGNFEEAASELPRAIADLDAAGSWIAGVGRVHLARAQAYLGRFDEAQRLLTVALDAFTRMNAKSLAALALLRRGELSLLQHHPDKAVELLAAVPDAPDTLTIKHRLQGIAMIQQGDLSGGRDLLLQAVEEARAIASRADEALALEALDRAGYGDDDAGRVSREIFTELGIADPPVPLPARALA